MKFHRCPEPSALADLVESRFTKTPLSEAVRLSWHAIASSTGDEHLEALERFSGYGWWETPDDILFSGFAGVGFLPDAVFSYYLPGCMTRSLKASQDLDPFGQTLFRISRRGYAYQLLTNPQLLSVGHYLLHLSFLRSLYYDGSLNLSITKLQSVLNTGPVGEEVTEINEQLSAIPERWAKE